MLSVNFHIVAGDMFPASYNMSIINAQHGSWDRTPAIGYRVMVLNLNSDGLAQNYSALAEGWLLPNGTVWGKQAVLCCAVLCRAVPCRAAPCHAAPWQEVLRLQYSLRLIVSGF